VGEKAIEERFVEVTRTARYYTLGTPGPTLRAAWLACHGYGQLAGPFVQSFQTIAGDDRLVVAPEALNRYYPGDVVGPHGPESAVAATWMTREDRLHEIDDYVRYLDRVYDDAITPAANPRTSEPATAGAREGDRYGRATAAPAERPCAVVAFGFSQGAATVARWAARTSRRVDHVVLWGASLPPELAPSADLFRGARLVIALGNRDRFMTEERVQKEERRLRRGSLPFELFRYDGGHRIAAPALALLAASLDPS
jgi:predicted esterase